MQSLGALRSSVGHLGVDSAYTQAIEDQLRVQPEDDGQSEDSCPPSGAVGHQSDALTGGDDETGEKPESRQGGTSNHETQPPASIPNLLHTDASSRNGDSTFFFLFLLFPAFWPTFSGNALNFLLHYVGCICMHGMCVWCWNAFRTCISLCVMVCCCDGML